MIQKNIWLIVRSGWLALALILITAVPPLHVKIAFAQATPPAECVTDQGHAIEPRPDIPNAWLLVLNFNHAPSADGTIGCVVTRSGPKQLDYTLIECWLHNNMKQATVGGGAANFDGYFWIECPGPAAGSIAHQDFDFAARAQFARPDTTYTLMAHPDVTIRAPVDNDWHVGLNSNYGQSSFVNVDPQSNIQGQTVALMSTVDDGTGSHIVNGISLTPSARVDLFDFDSSQSIVIGGAGEVWTLHEAFIDPAGHCCR